jgi:DNA-binding response OmpR family regulator
MHPLSQAMETDSPSPARIRVLVVDDEPSARFAVGDFLQTHGFEVETASDGRAARQAFRNRQPDAVILDYRLPDTDALELLARFKATDHKVPVLILTAHGSIDLAVRAIKAGADQFLTKPIALPSLLSFLERELEKRRGQR